MNVGFRPRLQARPSLYDLLAYRSIERLSFGAGSPIPVEDLPPLPPSTTASPVTPLAESLKIQPLQPELQPTAMAPKKAAKPAQADADTEGQQGR